MNTPDILNHGEAWSLAHMKSSESNLARCYIELRELAMKASNGPLNVADTKRLQAIVHANDI